MIVTVNQKNTRNNLLALVFVKVITVKEKTAKPNLISANIYTCPLVTTNDQKLFLSQGYSMRPIIPTTPTPWVFSFQIKT